MSYNGFCSYLGKNKIKKKTIYRVDFDIYSKYVALSCNKVQMTVFSVKYETIDRKHTFPLVALR